MQKVIHYCWFGGKPLNKLAKKCINSWKKYFPDYEIKEWNESNFDFNCCQYVKEAYEAKKWAFVSDYARYKILYQQGGVYFDTDVEVIKPFDDILSKGAFMGCENSKGEKISVASGLGCAVEPNNEFYKLMLESYEKDSFILENGELNLYTVVDRVTDALIEKGLEDSEEIQEICGIKIYPTEYFCPIDINTGKKKITKNTYSIHHYQASWKSSKAKLKKNVYRLTRRIFGKKITTKLYNMVSKNQNEE